MCIVFEEPKIHHAKKSRRFIQKKFHQKREKIHQAQKGASALRQERSLESASKWLKIIKLRNTRRAKGPKSSFNQEMKDQKKKKRKLAKLKTQKGGLGKS